MQIFFLLGLIIGIGIVFIILKQFNIFICGSKKEQKDKPTTKENNNLMDSKEKNKEKILKIFDFKALQGEGVTNDDVEKKLEVSDSTATRYLQELEEEGLIVRVGEGSLTSYRKA